MNHMSEPTNVFPVSSASKQQSHPKFRGPRGRTTRPSVLPSKRIGSVPGPALYANVQSAYASLVGNPSNNVLKPMGRFSVSLEGSTGDVRTFRADSVEEMFDVWTW